MPDVSPQGFRRAQLVLGAALVLAGGCGGQDAPPPVADAAVCATGQILEVDLETWKQTLEGMPDWTLDDEYAEVGLDQAPDYGHLLGMLGLAPLPDRTMDEMTPEQGVMTLVSVEFTKVRRGYAEKPDVLVSVHFQNAAGAESLRALVLRPLPRGDDVYCALGDDLSNEKESGEEPCMDEHRGYARTLSIEPLVAPDRDAIVVRDVGGWCGSGTRRGDRFSSAYWGVERGRLVRYFEAVTAEAWYESPEPPAKIVRREIALSESWPKTITLNQIVECPIYDDGAMPGEDCQPGKHARTYQYVDNRYLATDDSTK